MNTINLVGKARRTSTYRLHCHAGTPGTRFNKLYLRQPRFTCNACRHLLNSVKGGLKHIYRIELDKTSFAHDSAYSDSKDLAKRTVSDKILKDRAYEVAINRKYDGYQKGLATIVYKFANEKRGSTAIVNEELLQELHKPASKRINRCRVYARFKDNIWTADLAEMSSLSSKNRGKTVLVLLKILQ